MERQQTGTSDRPGSAAGTHHHQRANTGTSTLATTRSAAVISAAILCLIVAISDGDTIKARCPTSDQVHPYEQVKVRLSAIDAPEKRQPFGQRSRQHLAELCFQVEAKITPKSKDRYGRTVADVECRGKDAGTEQVQAGLAWYYVKYGKGYEHLADVEAGARDARRGLWADKEPVAPWEWRKTSTKR